MILWHGLMFLLTSLIYYGYETKILIHIWNVDVSKITPAIVLIGYYTLARLGYKKFYSKKGLTQYDLDASQEAGDLCTSLGLLGTVIGFIIMAKSFVGADLSSPESVKQLFDIATGGISVALYTTAAGLISSILIRLMSFHLLGDDK